MKLQQGAGLVEISKIMVTRGDRQRSPDKEQLEVADLQKSIAKRGLLNPIIISDEFVLKAGERRLTACRNLGMTKILARKVSELSPVEAQIIELEENIKRQDLEWQDLARGVATIHRLYTELDPDWTQAETAEECAITQGTVSMYISVWLEMSNERVAKAGTVREAHNMLQRRSQREAGEALQELLEAPDYTEGTGDGPSETSESDQQELRALRELGQPIPAQLLERTKPRLVAQPPPPPDSILHASFLDWAPQYSGPKFNLIHCDFPYGVELFSGPQGRGSELGSHGKVGYDDSVSTFQTLLHCLATNLDRVMSVSGHLMFWLSADYRIVAETVAQFGRLAPSLKFTKFPLVWVKSDNAGISSDPRHGPRHTYEVCLLAARGQRNLARVKADGYVAPTDKRLHPSTKPEPMLRHFMEMLVDETTSLLDPTCGSGAALRAADSLGAKHVLGLEIDRQYIPGAQLALKQSRAKRLAERMGDGL